MKANELTLNELFKVFGGSCLGVSLTAIPECLGSLVCNIQIKGE